MQVTKRTLKFTALAALLVSLAQPSTAYASSPNVEILEERLGVKVTFSLSMPEDKQEKAAQHVFVEIEYVSRTWDFFDWQMGLVRSLRIYPTPNFSGRIHPHHDGTLTLDLSSNEWRYGWYNNGAETLVHEAAHMNHFALKKEKRQELSRKWKELINGGRYVGSHLAKALFRTDGRISYDTMRRLGTTSWYGVSNHLEDIAETATFVYGLNNPQRHQIENQKEIPSLCTEEKDIFLPEPTIYYGYWSFKELEERLPIIRKKIELLREYSFFSQRETDCAIARIEQYRSLK